MRILLLSNAPTPNNDALFGYVAQQPGVELLVAYAANIESHRLWALDNRKDYPAMFLPGWTVGKTAHVNFGIGRVLRSFSPDVAILTGGYVMPTVQVAGLLLAHRQIPWAYWGEELQAGGNRLHTALRDKMRWVITRATGVFAVGTRAIESYVRAGVARRKVADFRYYPDYENFQTNEAVRKGARARLRSQLNIEAHATVFGFCGQLIHRKGVDTLLRAHALLQEQGTSCATIIVGDGPQRRELEALARSLKLTTSAHFLGFVQPTDLPECFAAADVLVVPSRREGWGLVVSEAMAAGLPVIASSRVNAAVDLIDGGRNGALFPVDDAHALAAEMSKLCRQPAQLSGMASAARAVAKRESPALAAPRMVELLQSIIERQDIQSSI